MELYTLPGLSELRAHIEEGEDVSARIQTNQPVEQEMTLFNPN